MEDLKLLLLIVLPAVALACIGGIAYGKHQLKKAAGQLRPLLTPKQRILYSLSIASGVICLLVGFLYNPVPSNEMGEDMYGEMEMMKDQFATADGNVGVEDYIDDAMPDMIDSPDAATGGEDTEDAIASEQLEDDDLPEEDDLPGDEVVDDAEAATDANSSNSSATVQAAPAPTVRRGSVRIGGRSGGNVVIIR